MTQPASALDRELAIEQAHVDQVYAQLQKATDSARRSAIAGRSIYTSDRGTWMRSNRAVPSSSRIQVPRSEV